MDTHVLVFAWSHESDIHRNNTGNKCITSDIHRSNNTGKMHNKQLCLKFTGLNSIRWSVKYSSSFAEIYISDEQSRVALSGRWMAYKFN